VNKAPAATIGDLAKAVKELAKVDNDINIIGTRHGEKLYETLCTREEMVKAEDMGDFYRVPADNRDLNYSIYFSEGEKNLAKIEDYHSHNTERLNVDEVKKLISKLAIVRREFFGEEDDEFME
jgi:UDP-glucose 4-epimerase